MQNEKLALIHKAHLKVLAEIQRICDKHGIRYFVDSGTLLGAVRHKAAIPWDDDADIAMLRVDFEKFRKVVRQELSDEFAYVEPSDLGNNAIFDIVPRVVLLNSQWKPDSEEEQYYGKGIYNHILVDIFIIDDMYDSDLMHKIVKGGIFFCYGLSMGHRYQINYEKFTGMTKIIVGVLSTIGKCFPAKWILKWYDAITKLGTGKNKKKNRCFYGNTLIQEIPHVYQKDWFANDCTLTMSGQNVNAPSGYHEILTTLYNDYMQLPPVEKRTYDHCNVAYVKVWENE